MEEFYEYEGISRQAYFQAMAREREEREMMAQIERQVRSYRQYKDRRAGSRSLYFNLDIKSEWGIGVTKFERLMSEYSLVLAPCKIRIVTTNACLRSKNYEDLTKGRTIDGINQLVVGDITYIQFPSETYYLFLLTDVYSARIVGYEFSNRMRAIEALAALDRWRQLRGADNLRGCIEHTDGGSQYFSNPYMKELNRHGIVVSVAENCIDNGYAEQRNGLFKHHFIPTMADILPHRLKKKIEEKLYFYNFLRKQEGLDWLSPVEFERKWANDLNAPRNTLYGI